MSRRNKEEEKQKNHEISDGSSTSDNFSHRRRILIVDDEEDVTFFLKEALEDYGGFEVVVFNDPLLALSSFNNKDNAERYDLILLDIKMPKMDGFQLYQELQKKITYQGHDSKKTKICFMTAFEVYYEALKELFPDSYSSVCFIRKPSSAQDLVRRISKEISAM